MPADCLLALIPSLAQRAQSGASKAHPSMRVMAVAAISRRRPRTWGGVGKLATSSNGSSSAVPTAWASAPPLGLSRASPLSSTRAIKTTGRTGKPGIRPGRAGVG